jgi:hypothetical protein
MWHPQVVGSTKNQTMLSQVSRLRTLRPSTLSKP